MGCLQTIFFPSVLFCFLIVFLTSIEPCRCDDDESQPNYSCPPTRCSLRGPKIRFPFGLQGCSYPGFEVSCKGDDTVLQLPSEQEREEAVVVRHIDYSSRTLEIVDSKGGCIESLLFHLNLSSSSFSYHSHYGSHDHTFVNCSAGVNIDLDGVNYDYFKTKCMSDLRNDVFLVYSVEEAASLPLSCETVKTVEIPYWYDRQSNVVVLDWDIPGCSGCNEAKGGRCGFKYKSHTTNETTCSYTPPHQGRWRKKAIIAGSVSLFVIIVAALMGMKFYCSWKLEREKDIENQLKVEKFLKDYKSLTPTRYSYADLKRMTENFKDKLGQGAFGSVYKGKLANGVPVAVKVLQKSGGDGEDFINEVGTIGRIHHVNVVRLLGFCTENFKRALIYEFMPNESLEKSIFSTEAKNPLLTWKKLQDIAIGIAKGIEYLHQGCDQRILHFDIKPNNILLDHNFNPKISDFGLAKLYSKGQSIVSMTAARGTMGYIAPEVLSRNFGNVSYKSDVYSFGMLLLEMVGGRKNIDVTVENVSQVYFPEWIYSRLHRGEDLGLICVADEDLNITKKLTTVALWCIQWYPVDRPSMKSVVQMLEGSMESLTMPPNPFASTGQPNADTTTSEETHATGLTAIEELEEGNEDTTS